MLGEYSMTKSGIDRAAAKRDVVEAAGIAGGGCIGVHRHLLVRIDPMQGVRDRRHEGGQSGLVGTPRTFKVEVHPVEVLRFDRSHQCLRQGGGRSGWRSRH